MSSINVLITNYDPQLVHTKIEWPRVARLRL